MNQAKMGFSRPTCKNKPFTVQASAMTLHRSITSVSFQVDYIKDTLNSIFGNHLRGSTSTKIASTSLRVSVLTKSFSDVTHF